MTGNISRALASLSLAILGCLLAASAVFARQAEQGVITDDQVNAIAKQLYCPVCENIPLDVCGTQACAQWRELIHEKLSQGWNEDQIKQYFVAQYGDRVLATPPARGLNWLVYLVPPLAILAGGFILYRAFKAWQEPSPAPSATATPSTPGIASQTNPQDEYIRRLEEELNKR